MNATGPSCSRRTFLAGITAAACTAPRFSNAAPQLTNKVCAFVKFVQSLSYDELAERIAEMGFDRGMKMGTWAAHEKIAALLDIALEKGYCLEAVAKVVKDERDVLRLEIEAGDAQRRNDD